jgi:hypothetical protein
MLCLSEVQLQVICTTMIQATLAAARPPVSVVTPFCDTAYYLAQYGKRCAAVADASRRDRFNDRKQIFTLYHTCGGITVAQ